jgi:Phage terminase large subunit (GpA)
MDDHDGADAIERAWRDGLKPDPLLTVSEWADRYRVLSQRASSEPGRWRTERTPYLREIMDCLSPASPVQRVALMKGAQIGGTECGNCADMASVAEPKPCYPPDRHSQGGTNDPDPSPRCACSASSYAAAHRTPLYRSKSSAQPCGTIAAPISWPATVQVATVRLYRSRSTEVHVSGWPSRSAARAAQAAAAPPRTPASCTPPTGNRWRIAYRPTCSLAKVCRGDSRASG